MARRTHKPRKRHIPKRVDFDAVGTAVARSALLQPHQRAQFLAPMHSAMATLKTGASQAAGMRAWAELADALNVAEQLCLAGIASDRLPTVLHGQAALAALHQRHAARQIWTLRAEEITALEGPGDPGSSRLGAIEVHAIQLEHCSQGEMADAIAAVARRVQQALAGNGPRDATLCLGALGHPGHPTATSTTP